MNGDIVKSITVTNATPRKVEKVLSGLLRNMGPDYFVDDSEADALTESTT